MATTKKLMGTTAVGGGALAIEDVFSTYLYTGNGSTQTITNGIDLAGEGGMVWFKIRNGTWYHNIADTERGPTKYIYPNVSDRDDTITTRITSFNSDGFSLSNNATVNASSSTYASWTFRKAPRFFDVVTYTGTGSVQNVSHNLGVAPGVIITKRTDSTSDWGVYHRSYGSGGPAGILNGTDAAFNLSTYWNDTDPTDTQFTLGSFANVNASGGTYVAYLFAHDPLGPSGDGSDGLIACGSYTGSATSSSSSPVSVDLGFEPQFLLVKSSSDLSNWVLFDNMRGVATNGIDQYLSANISDAEASSTLGGFNDIEFSSNGFVAAGYGNNTNRLGRTYIYIAIRRGPMRQPESGTEVFKVVNRAGTGTPTTVPSGFVTDFSIVYNRTLTVSPHHVFATRLTGNKYMGSSSSAAEAENSLVFPTQTWDVMNGVKVGSSLLVNATTSGSNYLNYLFKRAPYFYDTVTYTGTGVAKNISHNLQTEPELVIVKARNVSNAWAVYTAATGPTKYLHLDSINEARTSSAYWNNTAPTSSVFTVGTEANVNYSTGQFVAHLFATVPGVSKVGSYVGNGTNNRVINCGFSSGARFIIIKNTTQTTNWHVFDSELGIVSGNDPTHFLDADSTPFTSFDLIDPDGSGFQVNAHPAFNFNQSGNTYVYLAIA